MEYIHSGIAHILHWSGLQAPSRHVVVTTALHHHSGYRWNAGNRLRGYVSHNVYEPCLPSKNSSLTPRPISAYAIYFDHKRQTDPEFRRALKRESRREARIAKTQAEAQGAQQKQAIKAAVASAKDEGFPTDVEDKEAFFMSEVARGEGLCQDGTLQLSYCRKRASPWTSEANGFISRLRPG